ncbi:MAG TPA: hypothetical protein VK982_12965 [Bacteroidales bacterium]|nr:hypothetical protein [Bacteroidales bacterium]
MTNLLKNKVLNKIFNNSDFTITSTQLSLHTADPTDTGTNEVTGGSYARQTLSWASPANGEITTDLDVEFSNMPATTVTHVGIWDGTDFLWYGALPANIQVLNGQTVRISANDLNAIINEVI